MAAVYFWVLFLIPAFFCFHLVRCFSLFPVRVRLCDLSAVLAYALTLCLGGGDGDVPFSFSNFPVVSSLLRVCSRTREWDCGGHYSPNEYIRPMFNVLTGGGLDRRSCLTESGHLFLSLGSVCVYLMSTEY